MGAVDQFLADLLHKHMAAPRLLSCSDWADQYRIIAKGPERGQWRTERTPYLREPMNCTDPESPFQRVVMMFATQLGKALALNTPIPTPSGWSTMGGLGIGDVVFDELGKQCRIVNISPIYRDHKCYKVRFSDGSEIIADAGHRWTVDNERDYRKAHQCTLTTEEIARTFKNKNRNVYAIPVACALETADICLPIKPYTLGAWLGDGSSASAQITQHIDDVPHLTRMIQDDGYDVSIKSRKGNTNILQLDHVGLRNGFCRRGHEIEKTGAVMHLEKPGSTNRVPRCAECRRQYARKNNHGVPMDDVSNPTFYARLQELGLINNKHIPAQYLRASIKQRTALLHGLMDTDGTVCKKSNRVSIASSYPALASGIEELVRSLGFKPTVTVKKTSCRDSICIDWMAYSETPVFSMPRKYARQRSHVGMRSSETNRRRIVAVDEVDSVPVRCISVDSPSHLFLAGSAMIPTHNSEVLYNAVLKRIHISPHDMMMVQPTLQDAKDHSSQRFTQTARVMPYVLSNIAETRSRDETNTLLTKELANGSATLFFSGANSARSLASKPLGFAACDEVDGYPNDVDGEGDPVGLIEERMSNFPNRKLLMCSTPTTRDASRIETEYLASDRRRYHLPCPHCGGLQHLEWGNDTDHGIKWLKTDAGIARPETAVYICKHCGAAIQEHHKTEMLENGIWIPENPGAGRGLVAGFHMNKLYSPLGWKSWPMLVDQWLKAREKSKSGDHSLLKTFINTSLAQTWEEDGDKIDQHYLSRRAEDYRLRMVPFGCYFLTAGVDVQGDRLEVRVKGYGRGEESWTIDRHIIYGDPAIGTDQHGSPWAALDEYLSQPISHESGAALPIQSVAIDSGGHHTQQVYNYTRTRSHRNVFAVKGQSQRGKPIIGKPSDINVNRRGEKIKGQKLWLVGTDTAKALIYGRMRMIEVGPGYCHYSKDLPPDEFEQLTAERLVTRYIKGHAVMEFVKPAGRRNEALDCEVYALAAAYQLGMNRWKDADWDRYQRQAEPERKPDTAQQQKIAQPSTGKIGFSQLGGRFK